MNETEREKEVEKKKRNEFFKNRKRTDFSFVAFFLRLQSRSAFVRLRGFSLPTRHVSASSRPPGDFTRRHVDCFVRDGAERERFSPFGPLPFRIVRPSQLLNCSILFLFVLSLHPSQPTPPAPATTTRTTSSWPWPKRSARKTPERKQTKRSE